MVLLGIFVVLGIVGTTVYLTRQRQDVQSNAQTPDNSCTTPPAVQNVLITYPQCDASNNCSLAQANCSWSTVTGATGYQVTVTQTDSNTIVKTETITGTSSIFNVTQGKTYQCDVQAVNSCGQSGPAGSHTLLCEVNALVSPSPSPTITSSPTSTPTLPPNITPITYVSAPPPTLPPSGMAETTGIVAAGAAVFIFAGAALLFIL